MNGRLACIALLLAAAAFFASGCDRTDLEEQAAILMSGLDLDEDGNLIVYELNPVFSRDQSKVQKLDVKARTIRQARGTINAHTMGFLTNRKSLVIVVGQRLLQHPGWYPLLDSFLRDPKHPFTARFISSKAPIDRIMNYDKADQPLVPLLLWEMVNTKSRSFETVKTTVQELDRQIREPGVTPAISEIKLEPETGVTMDGSTLLDHQGKYAMSLNAQQSVLLQLLQKHPKHSVSLTLRIPGEPDEGPFERDKLSLNTKNVKTSIKTSHSGGKFHFRIGIKMPVVITERLFPYDAAKQGAGKLETQIAQAVKLQYASLIKSFQQHRIEPIGLGLYARAYEYAAFKKTEERWGDAFAKADVQISVDVTLINSGPVT